MTDDELQHRVRAYLSTAKMMQLATARNDSPWVCNVWFASDDDLNIYWISSTKRRHSNEIADNPRVAAAICMVHEPSEGDMGALQLEGHAQEVSGAEEINHAMNLYVKRKIFTEQQVLDFMDNPDFPHRFYRLKPKRFVYFDPTKEISTLEYIVD